MPRACASCSITALRSGSAPASASTFTSWRCDAAPPAAPASRWSCSRARGRTGWTRDALPGAARRRRRAFPSGSSTLPGIGWSGRRSSGSPERSTSPTRPTRCCCRAGAASSRSSPSTTSISSITPAGRRAEIRRDYPALAARHAQRADLVVVISEHTAREVRSRLGVAAERIVLCRPGAPPAVGCAATGAAGTDPVRRHDRAAQEPADALCRLRAAGGAHARTRRRWYWRAAQSSSPRRFSAACARAPALAGRVDYRGYVSDAERQALYASASMLVLPSFHEGFGLPAVEAMQAGVPVIASTAGRLAGGGRDCGHHRGSGRCGRFLGGDGTAAGGSGRTAAPRRGRPRAGAAVLVDGERGARCCDAYREAFARRTAR